MAGTEQDEVVEGGDPAVSPERDVVGVAPGDLAVTSRIPTPTIALGDRTEHVERNTARRSADIERRQPRHHDPLQPRVAQIRVGGRRRQPVTVNG